MESLKKKKMFDKKWNFWKNGIFEKKIESLKKKRKCLTKNEIFEKKMESLKKKGIFQKTNIWK